MKLIKPIFIHHGGNPIFSCDIHPDGLRFATGGQGSSCGRIAIWNLFAVTDEDIENDENVPKILCDLNNHTSCVNAVKWSHSGKWLASGGDDKQIMLWSRSGEPKVNSNGVIVGLEQWRCAHTLSAHDSDVLGLAWAPIDNRLASCSVDNSIVVWSMDGRPSVLVRLTGHDGLVKGVTWDPVGEYLASQSDDRTLRIWRTCDWVQQTSVTEPFKECGDVTYVLRLHWSPDGQYVVSAHASNSGGPTAQIIERPTGADKSIWPCDTDFVGHRKAVTCVRFNENLLKKPGSENKYCVLATGSRDCSIAIWSTLQRRPLFAINNVFKKAVLDMSWSADGRFFMASSSDGTVAFFHFEESELGVVASQDEKLQVLEGLYGKRLLSGKIEPIIETPELLTLEEPPVQPTKQTETEEKKVEKKQQAQPIQLAKQIETIGPNGKRRITPITVPHDADTNIHPFSSTSSLKTKIIVERKDNFVSEPPGPSAPKQKRISLVQSAQVISSSATHSVELRPPTEIRHMKPHLRPLTMDAITTFPVSGAPNQFIIVENSKDPLLTKVHRETRDGQVATTWELLLGHYVVTARSNVLNTVLASTDRSIHILDTSSGMYKILPLVLPGPVACLDLNQKQELCIVTTYGNVVTYDLSKKKQTLRDDFLQYELQDGAMILNCKINDQGYPIVLLNNGRSFSFSKELGWLLLTDLRTPLWQLSSQKEAILSLPAGETGPLRGIVRELRSISGNSSGRVAAVRAATGIQCSISLLNQQLLAAVAMGSEHEIKTILMSLVRLLAQEASLTQLRNVLTAYAEPRGWMSECVGVLKEFLHCQRLYVELTGLANGINGEESLGAPPMDVQC